MTALAMRPVMKDVTHLQSSEAMASRLADVMAWDEVQNKAIEQARERHPEFSKPVEVKGITPKHTEEIKRIDQTFPNQSLKSWDTKGQELVAEAQKREAEEAKRIKALQNRKWDFEKGEQPWDIDETKSPMDNLNQWKSRLDQQLEDFQK